ncbi:MAG: GNAT family N-acetyltransferase [Theionarchaea archaeon]|nr:GNAT family N-acetyltransferase [Theionarchaea archaeon]
MIRSLVQEDYDDMVTLWEESGLSYRSKGRDSKELLQKQIEENPDLYLGAFINDKLIGCVLATFDGRKGWINRLAVSPEYRKRGIGQQLIDAAEKALKMRGATVIGVLIFDTNTPSLNLFEKMGYTIHDNIQYVSKRDSEER